jgi:molybdate transport system substrate-binding protein
MDITRRRLGACVLAAFALLALAPGAAAQRITVFAAASLKNALEEIAGHDAVLVFASSAALARQIERGAPADVYISANEQWMDDLQQRGRIVAASRLDLLRNRLVLIAPAASRVQGVIAPGFPLARLLGGGRLAMGDPAHVPAGEYARAALETLGVWGAVQRRIAAADNVRAALALVSRREAPLGIVYATDAAIDPGVRIVGEFPAASHPPIVYPAALIAPGAKRAAARFLASLRAPPARAIFRKHGFVPLE